MRSLSLLSFLLCVGPNETPLCLPRDLFWVCCCVFCLLGFVPFFHIIVFVCYVVCCVLFALLIVIYNNLFICFAYTQANAWHHACIGTHVSLLAHSPRTVGA